MEFLRLNKCKNMPFDYFLNLSLSGVPEYLKKMLEIDKKSELEKYCKDIIITQEDFARLVYSSYSVGYRHKIKNHDFVPPHLLPSDEERNALSLSKAGETLNQPAKKLVSKISAIFNDRRCLVAHIFYNQTKWHLFYFDNRDMENICRNHWKEGAHVHFVNYLWPNYDIKTLWGNFDKKDASAGDRLHIRFQRQRDE